MSGAGFGGLVLAPIIRSLISHVGVRWALRCLGFINFAVTFPIGFVVRREEGGGRRGVSRGLVNLRVARRKVFVFEVGLYTLSSSFWLSTRCLRGIDTLRLLVFIWTGIDSRVWGHSYMPQPVSCGGEAGLGRALTTRPTRRRRRNSRRLRKSLRRSAEPSEFSRTPRRQSANRFA